MPRISKYRKKIIDQEKRVAFELYQEGKTMREVAEEIGRSVTFVWGAINELDTPVDISTRTKVDEE